jgi:UDP-4-amino-4,6-dideoxy-N-acetyl-beta-L-altrosamine transaminase
VDDGTGIDELGKSQHRKYWKDLIVIPYGRQDIRQEDLSAVLEVLQSDFLTQGPAVPRFEEAVASYCNARRSLATNSATSALHISLLALDVGPGDWVWTSPNTFVASSNAALYCGASVDFVDIDPHTFNMSVSILENKLSEAQKNGKLPKVVVPVHLAGQSCDMLGIHKLAKHYGFKIVEDASHAIGGQYLGLPIGNCIYSDITVFSFHPVKIITAAEGGMALTNDDALADKMNLLRSHGITRDPALMSHSPDGPWYYQQVALGYNYRMSDLHAALGLSQMTRLNEYVDKRHKIADFYSKELVSLPLELPFQESYSRSSYHLYIIRLQRDKIAPLTHNQVFESLRDQGILVNIHYIPVHTQPYYRAMGFKWGDFPNAEAFYRSAISIPMFPTLNETDQKYVISSLQEILKN